MLGSLSGAVLGWTVYVLVFRRDRRRLRTGVLLLIALVASVGAVVAALAPGFGTGLALLTAATGLGMLGVLVAGLSMLWNGLMAVQEDYDTRGSLCIGLGGLSLLAAPLAAAGLVRSGAPVAVGLGALLLLLALHAGLTFLAILGAALPYQLLPRRLDSGGVIVLGSALVDGELPPLLRSRLDWAARERERLLALGIIPLLVPSGGQGPCEPRAEGEVMARYLREVAGVPASDVLAETASRTTEENLLLSRPLLEAAGHQGPFTVCTSRYHAFRAALLARQLGHDDEVIGSPTALRDVPSAVLREVVILLSYRKRWFTAAALPTLALVVLLLRAPTAL
ncbi:YdcF family protein [Brachybacterium sp. AOP43-C2-M15]|uniref:YdcF family protein n=1 Tax=Brachybacterium sp. AOP43-C2-M15 TaxID=3457661 RepID=UPI0040342F3E